MQIIIRATDIPAERLADVLHNAIDMYVEKSYPAHRDDAVEICGRSPSGASSKQIFDLIVEAVRCAAPRSEVSGIIFKTGKAVYEDDAKWDTFETEGWLDSDKPSLRQWIENHDRGVYANGDVRVQCDAGWFDWFCSDDALAGKTRKLASKVKKIARSPKVDTDKSYVFFKNNCPGSGTLYDDFRICDRKTGNVIYTVIPRSGHYSDHGAAQVYGKLPDGKFGELVSGSWQDVLTFFGV